MKFARNFTLYAGLIIIFGGLIFYLLHTGKKLDHAITQIPKTGVSDPAGGGFFSGLFQTNVNDALPRLLLQIIIIIATTQLLGSVFRKIGQPAVIGETVAGILLGPSLLGLLFPSVFHFIFPVESLPNLRFLSQLGLILFMFIVGMELDIRLLRKQAFDALIISHASILIPFSLGIGLSMFLYETYAGPQTNFYSFALFMGIAMSITAFPVLARIIRDRKLTETKLGILAITCAASDDVTAWCLLALLIALIRNGSGIYGLLVVGMVILYAFMMLVPVRLILKRIQVKYETGRIGYNSLMSVIFILLLFSSWCTEVIGIHALFGAFLAGIVLPKNEVIQRRIIDRISDISMVMLLPLFFVYTGLRTHAGILNSGPLWISFGLILICAMAGKFGGSALVARALGQTWKDSLSIGALMNTRGLMELIVLNIGYDMGILSTEIFSMMVLMALITTMMTSPLLNRIGN
ncbi:MAG: cation:proton antiporter [Bacteroidota bacterium]|nr:cation:proton antiporter [Bacteroidota bacterium]